MPDNLKFIYHLGVHKTGTTFLQKHLVSNKEALLDQGVWTLNGMNPDWVVTVRDRLRRIQNPQRRAPENLGKASTAKRLIAKARALGVHSVVLSEENLIGVPIHRELGWSEGKVGFYPRAEICLKALTYGIDPSQVRVIIYTRQLPGLLSGHYSEALRAMATGDKFDAFLDKTRLEEFRFDLLGHRLQRALPGAEFVFRSYESVRFGAPFFVHSFFKLCGATDMDTIDVRVSKVRPGLDMDQARKLRGLYRQLEAGGNASRLRARAKKVMAMPGDRAKPLRIPKTHVDRVEAAMRGDLSTQVLEVA